MNFTRRFTQLIERHLLGPHLREVVQIYRYLGTTIDIPELVEVPLGQRILVLAPHMDDEVIGCGGTLAKHADKGCEITVAVLTDGSLGDPESEAQQMLDTARAEARKKLTDLRRKESLAAAKCLGVQQIRFFDFPDGRLVNTPDALMAVTQLISDYLPDVLYSPSFHDQHTDHRAVGSIVAAVASRWPDLLVANYEVWSPIHANWIVDITNQINRKREALNCFSSQLWHNDYHHTIFGLNAFRTIYHLHGHGYAEAFFAVPARVFADIANTIRR